jgi:hypothetical protein
MGLEKNEKHTFGINDSVFSLKRLELTLEYLYIDENQLPQRDPIWEHIFLYNDRHKNIKIIIKDSGYEIKYM